MDDSYHHQRASDFRAIIDECNRLRKELQRINDTCEGPLEAGNVHNTKYPFALILGNHSSGKSTFINHILGSPVQTSGVAPTDDCFTIIGHGEVDSNRNGSAVVGDPDLGFQGLLQFGPMLVHKTQLKLRANIALEDMIIVDSPGMIDAPSHGDMISTASPVAALDRGYDFEGVVRWFAERADVILLFFDPDKPGTTSETITILTRSIVGLDEKVLLILNKADRFEKVHDFARTYGALCWNLAKVIPRKDLPQIYTMCVPRKKFPVTPGGGEQGHDLESPIISESASQEISEPLPDESQEKKIIAAGIQELDKTRAVVTQEVFNAPKRRVDNEISRLTECVSEVVVHAKVLDFAIWEYQSARRQKHVQLGILVSAGVVATAVVGLKYDSLMDLWKSVTSTSRYSPQSGMTAKSVSSMTFLQLANLPFVRAAASTASAATLASLTLFQWHKIQLRRLAAELMSKERLQTTFETLFSSRKGGLAPSYLGKVWKSVHDKLIATVTPDKLEKLPRIDAADMKLIMRLQDEDVPALRRRASPSFATLPEKPFVSVPPVTPLERSPVKEKVLDLAPATVECDEVAARETLGV